jgi:hypothetical protein
MNIMKQQGSKGLTVRPVFEVADVINTPWQELLRSQRFNAWQLRTLDAIRRRGPPDAGHLQALKEKILGKCRSEKPQAYLLLCCTGNEKD